MVKSRVGVSPAPSSSSLSPSTAACPTEYCVLLMGTWHKKPLFEQLRSVAHKFEQHIQYADTCYLTFQFGPETVVLELIDPGTEHTGAREMAIRKADAAILCYAAYSPASFHTLASIADDFQWLEQGRQPVALLLCDEDQLIENSRPGESGERERADDSEGYASNSSNSPPEGDSPPLSPNSRRRSSMDRIQRGRNEGQCPISREQGEQLAKMFGPDSEFRSRSFQSAECLPDLVQQLIQRIKQHRQNSQRQRSRSRSGSRRRPSPIIPSILRRSSLKKLLTHSKSDAAKRGSHDVSAESAVEQQQKRHSTLGTALRVLTHPLQRTKSQNKVAAANNTERNDTINGSQHSLPAASAASGPRTPFGLEVIPPTGEPCAEPFAYDPVRVNNFVGADQQQNGGETNGNGQQQTKRASILGMERPPTGKGIRLRAFSSPTGSTACVIQ